MIEEILPASTVAVEARQDQPEAVLFPQERSLVDGSVEKRRLEFATARACARAALEKLEIAPAPILTGDRGEPRWPAEIVGSITHCDGYRACAVARADALLTVGIDAEPNAALPNGLLADIARSEELPWVRQLQLERPEVHWDRLLFSAKESVYKAWYPLAKRWLGFEDAVLSMSPDQGTFEARLTVAGPPLRAGRLTGFSGRWMVCDGLILTAIAVAHGSERPEMLGSAR
ncbi:MAG: 4'-phosphopantetheinyl transferase superfamily protein [Solirubrobacteraceae bacterium]